MIIEKIVSYELKNIIKNYSISYDEIGLSPTKVFKLVKGNDSLFLKVGHKKFKNTTYEVKREKEMILWLQGKLDVPKIIHFEESDEYDFMLMSKCEGDTLYENKNISPEEMVDFFVESIKKIQSVNISSCLFYSDIKFRLKELDYLLENKLAAYDDFYEGNTPFSAPEELTNYLKNNIPDENLVFSHGDLTDANIFSKNGKISGFIDWARGGKADIWQDIALCVRSIKEDFKEEKYLNIFFNKMQIEPDWDKINYYLWLDELF